MAIVTAIVVFVLIWWTVLFAVLPFGTRPTSSPDPISGWRGAPAKPRIGAKLVATTLVSLVLFAVIYWLITRDSLSFRSGWLGAPDGR